MSDKTKTRPLNPIDYIHTPYSTIKPMFCLNCGSRKVTFYQKGGFMNTKKYTSTLQFNPTGRK